LSSYQKHRLNTIFGFLEVNEALALHHMLQEEFIVLVIYSSVTVKRAALFPPVPITTAGW